jgi:hypothetical protein
MTQFCDYCAVLPNIYNLNVDGNGGGISNVVFTDNKLINFTFNSFVDPNQTPMVGYWVDWGDDEMTEVSGVEMYNKPDVDNPHSLYHIYDYWGLRKKFVQGSGRIECADAGDALGATGLSCDASANCCAIKPKVKIKDNWGYCNNGCNKAVGPCPAGPCPSGGIGEYVPWGADWATDPFIIVYER